MDSDLSRDVQLQFLRPAQLEAAGRRFPVAYVPFGLIEYHGKHLPLGNDALKAHAILVKCAEAYGGVVHPPIYQHGQFDQQDHLRAVLTELFDRLRKTGFRVIMGVSGHNVDQQIDMIDSALGPVIADGKTAGEGLWEISLTSGEETGTDHAAKWETSNMMFFHPDLVDMAALGDDPVNEQGGGGSHPSGIGGLDPRKHASTEVGRRNVELCVESIGKRAQELLVSLPEGERGFNPVGYAGHPEKGIVAENWWMV